MKDTFIFIFFSIVLVVSAGAQALPDKNPDRFQLGTKTVNIPPPEDFEDVTGRIKNDKGRFADDDAGGLLSLAVPEQIISRLNDNPMMPLDIYTKVKVDASSRVADTSPELYAAVVSEFEKNFSTLFDAKGKTVTDARRDIKDFVTRVSGKKSKVELSPVRNLGYFQKTENVFSAMMLMTIEVNGNEVPMMVTVSLLRINDRLINAAVYKRQPTEQDFTLVSDFTKKWTARIVEANRPKN